MKITVAPSPLLNKQPVPGFAAHTHWHRRREKFLDGFGNVKSLRAFMGATSSGDEENGDRQFPSFRAPARRLASLELGQPQTGRLSQSDPLNPKRPGRFADTYVLTGFRRNQPISISVRSSDFDTYLQLIDAQTGKILTHSDDAYGTNTNSRIPFLAKAGATYQVRVTSFDTEEIGQYTLTATRNAFDRDYGYGLVNAAAAVARAVGRSPFPSVPNWGKRQWNLNQIKAPEVWTEGFTGAGVVVAVLDTGVDYTHPDLVRNIWRNADEIPHNGIDDDQNGFVDDVHGWNFVDGSTNNPRDRDGHGTHVAGTIAAARNRLGMTGVAYNAKIMPVRVVGGADDASLARFDRNVAEGIRYAVANGANVINLSLGNEPTEPPMPRTEAALSYAQRRRVVVVMAAGNEKQEGARQPIEPASYAALGLGIAVGAIGGDRTMADFSNPAGHCRMPFVVAPGINIWSTQPNGQYGQLGWSGTSMATPHVAGVVALMLSANPKLTPDQVATILTETANFRNIQIG